MAYSSLAEVKEVLEIPVADATWDTEITICITSADAIINARLADYEDTLPIAAPPQIIKEISKHMAAGIFQKRRHPAEEPSPIYDLAKTWLDEYMQENYKDEIAFIVGEDTS